VQGFDRGDERAFSLGKDAIQLFAPPTTPRRRIADPRAYEALLFEPGKRGVDRAEADPPLRLRLDLRLHCNTKPVLAKSQESEKHDLFELTQDGGHYFSDISGDMTVLSAKTLRQPKM
jgi:hypothetical protein